VPRRPPRGGLVARSAAALALGAALVPPAQAEPGSDPAASADADAVVSGTVRVLERGLFGGLSDAPDRSGVLVYLTGFREPAPDGVALLRQRDETFHPQLLPIVAGQTVAFPNEDPIYHNVFSVSSVQAFDLGQYKAGESPRSVVFARPGLVPVYCNIHPEMISYVVVLENAAFARTDAAGDFEIRGVPPGRLVLNAWVPGAERVSRELEFRPGGRARVELELRRLEKTPKHKRKDGSEYPKKSPYGRER
jgi:plastocyanin